MTCHSCRYTLAKCSKSALARRARSWDWIEWSRYSVGSSLWGLFASIAPEDDASLDFSAGFAPSRKLLLLDPSRFEPSSRAPRAIHASPRSSAARSAGRASSADRPADAAANRTVAPWSESTGASTMAKSLTARLASEPPDPRRHRASSASRLRTAASSPSESLSLSSTEEEKVDEPVDVLACDVGVEGSVLLSVDLVFCAPTSLSTSPDLTSASACTATSLTLSEHARCSTHSRTAANDVSSALAAGGVDAWSRNAARVASSAEATHASSTWLETKARSARGSDLSPPLLPPAAAEAFLPPPRPFAPPLDFPFCPPMPALGASLSGRSGMEKATVALPFFSAGFSARGAGKV